MKFEIFFKERNAMKKNLSTNYNRYWIYNSSN